MIKEFKYLVLCGLSFFALFAITACVLCLCTYLFCRAYDVFAVKLVPEEIDENGIIIIFDNYKAYVSNAFSLYSLYFAIFLVVTLFVKTPCVPVFAWLIAMSIQDIETQSTSDALLIPGCAYCLTIGAVLGFYAEVALAFVVMAYIFNSNKELPFIGSADLAIFLSLLCVLGLIRFMCVELLALALSGMLVWAAFVLIRTLQKKKWFHKPFAFIPAFALSIPLEQFLNTSAFATIFEALGA